MIIKSDEEIKAAAEYYENRPYLEQPFIAITPTGTYTLDDLLHKIHELSLIAGELSHSLVETQYTVKRLENEIRGLRGHIR